MNLRDVQLNTPISFRAILKSYDCSNLTKTGKPYSSGVLYSGDSMQFKAWNNSSAHVFLSTNTPSTDVVVDITAKVDNYRGALSLNIMEMSISDDQSRHDLITYKYSDTYFDKIKALLSKRISENGFQLWSDIVEPHLDRFVEEWAGNHMHDACYGGLLGHSYKVTLLIRVLPSIYPHIWKTLTDRDNGVDYKNSAEIPIFVASMHDLGKIWEYQEGEFSDLAWASHRVLMNEYLTQFKDQLIEHFGTKGYYRILSAEAQHHGSYEEVPRTIEGFIVHMVDQFDTNMTILSEGLEKGEPQVRVGDFRLS